MSSTDEAEEGNVGELEIQAIIGFDGSTVRGFVVHPDGKHVVYPLGNKVTIQDWTDKTQRFLSGHTNIISAIDVSRSGRFIASGQINHIGFKARVIIWDFETGAVRSQHELHKVRVESVAFSADDQYCLSLGGRDCASVVVWDVNLGQVICGATVSRGVQGEATTLLAMNRRGACFMTAGDNHLAVWRVDREARNVRSIDVTMAKLKRVILCMDVNERDEVCFAGTSTGDVLKIRLNYHHDPEILEPIKHPIVVGCFAKISKKSLPRGNVDLYSQGVTAIRLMSSGRLVIGAGDGTLQLVEESKPKITKNMDINLKLPSTPVLKVIRSTSVKSLVTSIQFLNGTTILVATSNSEIFSVDLETFTTELLVTCHTSTIYDLAFPCNFSDVFATAGKNDVRVWSMKTTQELLRIRVQNFSCANVLFSYDGKSILTAWNDGYIRSFTPLTGRLIYAIPNAHNKGVSALTTNKRGNLLVSGGCEGQVRLWDVCPYRQELMCTLKEHKAPISSIHINEAGDEAVSASTDGSCIIWDLVRQCRRQILFGNTLFMCARYFPSGVQILSGGSDRKLCYWEVLDGSLVREVEGSRFGAINTLDISSDGSIFVTGGNDQIVKVWKYQEGITTHVGLGHSSVITSARFSPDEKTIVTASASGSIFIWKCPFVKAAKKSEVEVEAKRSSEEEVIQDLPSARNKCSKDGKEDTLRVCLCKCPKREAAGDRANGEASSKASSRFSNKNSVKVTSVLKC